MPRWPAFARRARLPGPVFWDVVLALALAALSLVTIEADRGVAEPVPPEVKLSSTPFGLDPGDRGRSRSSSPTLSCHWRRASRG